MDNFRFVEEDLKWDSPSLEAVLNLAKFVGDWEPIVNQEGDNIVGYRGEPSLGIGRILKKLAISDYDRNTKLTKVCSYVIVVKKPGQGYTLTLSDPRGVLATYSGDGIEELFNRANTDFKQRINQDFEGRLKGAKDLIKDIKFWS